MEFTDFFTWQFLATFAGATAATALITQFVKGMIPATIPTRLVTYMVALAVIILATFFTGQLTISSGILSILNAVLITLAANGGYDAITKLKK